MPEYAFNLVIPAVFRSIAWQDFHKSVLSRGRGLDFLVEFLQQTVDGIGGPLCSGPTNNYNQHVSFAGLHSHYFRYLCHQPDKSDRSVWNLSNNILRYLKNMQAGTEFILLSEGRDAAGFLGLLQFPPDDEFGVYNVFP
ncbi:MAG: hypothetical protein ABIF10_01555 [Candidatus Woesearchaeota archaeon]